MPIRIRDRNQIPEVVAKLDEINGARITVGVLGDGENHKLAAIHEFGVTIIVTPKMRKFLAAKGLYLKKSTTVIKIPERSFIRAGWDLHEADVRRKAAELAQDIVDNGISADDFLEALGTEGKGYIQEYAIDLRDPANHPFTIDQKGSSNPLIDSGGMVGAIDFEIRK